MKNLHILICSCFFLTLNQGFAQIIKTEKLTVKNTGLQEGDEVVQAYVRYPAGDRMPLKELKGFQRVSIPRGGEQRVAFSIPVSELEKWDLKESRWKLYPGTYHIVLGEHSADSRLSSSFEIRKKVK